MRISYATACAAASLVSYGLTPACGSTATGAAPTQYTSLGYTSPYLHHVTLTGLGLNTLYYYTVGDATSGASTVRNFTSHPGVGAAVTASDGSPFVMALIGDAGQTDNTASTFNHIAARVPRPSMIMHVGDLSYADSDEPRWDSWGQLVESVASVIPCEP